MKNHYNFVSKYYDRLSTAVFSNDIQIIQDWLIQHLPAEGNLLILGGGTGRILPQIYQQSPNLNISFLEASSEMIELAKKYSPAQQNVKWIHSDRWEEYIDQHTYIYAAFFLDCLTEDEINTLIPNKGEQVWYVADFDPRNFKSVVQRIKIMMSIIFFKVFGHHSLWSLPDAFGILQRKGYKPLKSNRLKSQYVFSQILKTPSH
ncbi:class I SAM-dependent methyltransferase [bacterium]|nr:class I SAM-dependent methyltransferase [bacterium]